MADKHSIRRFRQWYARLLRLYPKPYRERFGEGMEQTFTDLLQERAEQKEGFFGCALWMFIETSGAIMRENVTLMGSRRRRLVGMALVIAFLLLLPLVAMQFTDEVEWGLGDFVAAAVLLGGAALAYELISRTSGNTTYRAAVGMAVVTTLLLIWANLAVGLIGSENNPANVMYDGVFVIGIIGATIARLRPQGMARTLFAMALAQALIPIIALLVWPLPAPFSEELMVVVRVTAFFVMLFVVSGLLFRHASATGSQGNRQTSPSVS